MTIQFAFQAPALAHGEGVQELDSAPWTLLFPAAFLVATLAAFQFLGDGLRDWLDVRGEGARGEHESAAA